VRRELGAIGAALATMLVAPSAVSAEPAPRDPLVFVADPKLGVETTVRTTDSLARVIYRYEDALPSVDLDERTIGGKAVAVLGRGLKLVLLDEPIAEIASLVSHEVAGHGARARELGLDPTFLFYLPGIYRRIFAPSDDAPAGAYTQYLSPSPVEGDRAIVGTLGGLEANYVHAWWINARIVRAGGRVHHGDLLVYMASKLSYANSFFSVPGEDEAGNDVGNYVSGLQDRSNQWRAEDRRRIAGRLGAAYLWNLFDPTLLYAAYGTLVSSIWEGRRVSNMPLPRIDGTTVFLSPRFALSPFGAEHTLDLFLARGRRMVDLYGRVGSSGLADSYGAGVRVLGLPVSERVALGGELDVWRQPEILLEERGVYDRPYRLGMNAGVFGDVHVAGAVGITGKLAVKTPGFIVGQPIGGGVHGYVGMSVAWR
jgi:hypothetical protein